MITFDFTDQNLDTYKTFRVEAETENEACEKAKEHFGETYDEGRWEIRNEGEDSNGNVNYIHFVLERPLYVVKLVCPHHPWDGDVIGVYSTSEKAKQAIRKSIEIDIAAYPNHPRRDEQQEINYQIHDKYLDE